MPACFGQVQPKKWTIRFFFSRILVVVCGGLPVSSLVTLPIVPNSGGDLWWFAVVCGGLSFSHTHRLNHESFMTESQWHDMSE